MKIRGIRHIVADSNHNMCTGALPYPSKLPHSHRTRELFLIAG